ncbi:hypothetical protein MnTg02_02350 [bacterium MnTg02]|nr:hypothetical protein MnTg02_02350 [bacterium MnTg02]
MKPQDFGKSLQKLADALVAINNRADAQSVAVFAALLDVKSPASVAALKKKLDNVDLPSEGGGPTSGELANTLGAFRSFFDQIAKPAFVKDLDLIISLLSKRPSTPLERLVALGSEALATPPTRRSRAQTVREDVINECLRKLRDTLGDEGRFMTVYNEMSKSKGIYKNEAVAIAKEFAGASAKTKAEAWKKVKALHSQMLNFDAKSKATAGRTAA